MCTRTHAPTQPLTHTQTHTHTTNIHTAHKFTYIHICRVEGSSVNLKSRFAGYNIELVVKQNSVNEVMAEVAERLTGMTATYLYCTLAILCGMVQGQL